jgi:hypothetical protein
LHSNLSCDRIAYQLETNLEGTATMTTLLAPSIALTLATAVGPKLQLRDVVSVGREKAANDTGALRGMDELKVFAKGLRATLAKVVKAMGPGFSVSVRCSWSTHTPALDVSFTMPGTIYTPEFQALLDSNDASAYEARRALSMAGQRYNEIAADLTARAH